MQKKTNNLRMQQRETIYFVFVKINSLKICKKSAFSGLFGDKQHISRSVVAFVYGQKKYFKMAYYIVYNLIIYFYQIYFQFFDKTAIIKM